MEIQFSSLQIDRTLQRLLRQINNGTDLATLIGEEMTLAVDDHFRDEKDPDGNPWAALSPDYVAWKRRKGFNTKILQMRGDLRARVAYRASSDQVAIGTDTPYARRQHEKRPFLFMEDGRLGRDDEIRVERVAEDYLRSLLKD